mmetsp:Transcript_9474/g.14010  ORF Transcript_9474/g.14010 Transcript_9474/m.14010 type:complete len:335 (-) Transcript_9474:5-1009(-)
MQPWVEKYRPKTIKDVVFQDEVTTALETSLHNQNLPHLLFFGPPGTGKTSTIHAVAKQLFGPEYTKSRVLELNASDARGIQVIRNEVKTFAQLAVERPPPSYNYPCPPFKLIVLDEADSMTKDAQAALRRTMEVYSEQTRFCIICNYVSRIIEPVASRCAKYRFKPLQKDCIRERLLFIAKEEHVDVAENALDALEHVSGGDLRRAITLLQSASRIYPDSEIQETHIVEVAGVIPQEWMDRFIALLNPTKPSGFFQALSTFSNEFIREAFPLNTFLNQLHAFLISSTCEWSDIVKANGCLLLARVEKALLDGADEYLQLLDVGAHLYRQLEQHD